MGMEGHLSDCENMHKRVASLNPDGVQSKKYQDNKRLQSQATHWFCANDGLTIIKKTCKIEHQNHELIFNFKYRIM